MLNITQPLMKEAPGGNRNRLPNTYAAACFKAAARALGAEVEEGLLARSLAANDRPLHITEHQHRLTDAYSDGSVADSGMAAAVVLPNGRTVAARFPGVACSTRGAPWVGAGRGPRGTIHHGLH